MVEAAFDDSVDALVAKLTEGVRTSACTVAVAESLTGGQLAAAISAAEGSGDWFRGGIVAYHPEVKYELLDAPRGPVVTAETALAMARAAVRLLGADHAVAVTGVGGPGPEEGEPAGTVYLAVAAAAGAERVRRYEFSGDPVDVMAATIRASLTELTDAIAES